MLTLITGTDPFLVHEAAHTYADALKHDGKKVDTFESPDTDDVASVWQAITQEISSGSLFSQQRVVLVWDPPLNEKKSRAKKKTSTRIAPKAKTTKSMKKGDSDNTSSESIDPLSMLLDRAQKQTSLELVLIHVGTDVPELIKKSVTHRIDVVAPSGSALRKWIADRASARGVSFSPMIVDLLIARVGTDFWRLANEVEKLVALGSEVTVADAERLIIVQETMGPYDVIDAVARRDFHALLAAVHRALRHGEQPIVVLNTIVYQIRILLIVLDAADRNIPEAEIIAAMKLHPYVISKARAAVRAWNRAELEQWFHQMAHLEWSIKKQQVEGAVGLDLTILSLMQMRPVRTGAR